VNPILKLLKQTFIYGLSTILPRFLNYLLVPLYTYYFAPQEYGIVADLYSWAVIINIILTLGLETTFFRFANKEEYDYKIVYFNVFLIVFLNCFLFGLTISLFYKAISITLGYDKNYNYIIWMALIIILDAINAIPFVKLRLKEKAFKFSIIKIINVIVNVFLNFVFIIVIPYLKFKYGLFINYHLDVKYIFIANFISSFIVFILLLPDFPNKIVIDKNLISKILAYSIPLFIAGLAGSVNDVIDRQFIKYFIPADLNPMKQLGIYFANVKIAVILLIGIQTFRFASEPFFFNFEKNLDSKKVFSNIMNYFIIACLIISLFTIANLSWIKYFIGVQYWDGLKIIPVVLIANVFVGIFMNLSIWYKLSDKTIFGLYIIVFGAILSIILNYLFVPHFGYYAAAINRAFVYLIMIVACYILGQKFYKIEYNLKKITKLFIIALCGYLFLKYFKIYNKIFILILDNFVVFVISLLFLKDDIKKFIRKKYEHKNC